MTTKPQRHKHWYCIRAWADGWEIEKKYPKNIWSFISFPDFNKSEEYRVVPDYEGWLPWYGGECPIDKDTLVEIKTNKRIEGYPRAEAKVWNWDNVTSYRIIKEDDPYAELKAAAKDLTKQIRCNSGSCNEWINSNKDGSQWAFIYPPKAYEIRDKPKPTKMKLLAYVDNWGEMHTKYESHVPSPGWIRVPSEDKEIEVE